MAKSPLDQIIELRAEIGRLQSERDALRVWQREASAWLAACLGFVTGEGPPHWDGIRAFLSKPSDEQSPGDQISGPDISEREFQEVIDGLERNLDQRGYGQTRSDSK